MDFFNKEDLDLVGKWGDKDYDSDNTIHKQAGIDLREGPATKTKYWCEKVASEVGMAFTSRKIWHKQAGRNGFKFRPYTWGKIFDDSQPLKDIYFTVGIRGSESQLHIKIDYQFEKSDELSRKQWELAKKLLHEDKGYKYDKTISASDLPDYNWDRLIKEAAEFINQHKNTYYEIVEAVNEKRNKFFTRICWNTNGWTKPSGPVGKSTNKHTFEGITGIGLEEWLFSDLLKEGEYQYGFIQANNIQKKESPFDVDLYTIHNTSEGTQPYWVASIKNMEVLDKEDAAEVQKRLGFDKELSYYYKSYDIKGKVKDSIFSFPGDLALNVRFRIEDVTFPEEDEIVPIELDTLRYHRYSLFEGSIKNSLHENGQETLELSDTGRSRSSNHTSSGTRSPGSYQITHWHDRISEKLEEYLNSVKLQNDSVIAERGLGRKAIDMVHKKENEIIYYEIKTMPKINLCIREALGQLLEYGYYKRNGKKDLKLIITTPHAPTQAIRNYFELLQNKFNLPMHYQQFDLDKNELGELI